MLHCDEQDTRRDVFASAFFFFLARQDFHGILHTSLYSIFTVLAARTMNCITEEYCEL